MTLLSRLIKAHWANQGKQEKKIIAIKRLEEEMNFIENLSNEESITANKEILLHNANEEAETIISEAKLYAQSIKDDIDREKAEWEEKKIQLYNEAKQKGFGDGLEEGRKQGYEEMTGLISEARKVVDLSKIDYRQKIESSESTILDLALKVAETIIGHAIEENQEYFLSVVKRAIKEAREYKEIQLHIHPNHYEFLLSQKEDLLKMFPKEAELYIYPDEDLLENGCVIESGNGRIDATVDTQLQEIKQKLFELLESE